MKKQVGIFSGSFNPIHVGHLILANYMQQFTYLDEVWMVVSPQNPLKKMSELLDDDERLRMTKLALEEFDNLQCCDIEFQLPIPSYTVDTLRELTNRYPDCEFSLIIGADNWADFTKWKDFEYILSHYKVLIYPRLGENVVIDPCCQDSVRLVQAPIVEVSSTFIRESLKSGKDVRAFLPEKVYARIIEQSFYR